MRSSVFTPVLRIAVIALAATILIVPALGLYSAIRPQKITSQFTPRDFGLNYEPVSLQTLDGIAIAGWFVPKTGQPNRSAIIVLHGYPADKGDLLARMKFLAEEYNLLFIDFRYFGQSGGRYSTFGAREINELFSSIEYLKERGIEKIGVYGFSMGGAVALMVLPKTSAIGAVISEAAYADLPRMSNELYRNFGPLKNLLSRITIALAKIFPGIDAKDVSPAAAAAATRVPVLLIHSQDDAVIPFENARIIQASLSQNPNAEFFFPAGLAHGESPPNFEFMVSEFFRKFFR